MNLKIKICLCALPLALAGCAGTDPKDSLNDVNRAVTERSGWPINGTNNNVVNILLQTNLTAQSAVTIALMNNGSMQAKYEEIGISQAELAQASRLHNLDFFGSWRFPNRPPSAVDAEYSVTADFLDLLTLPARKKIAKRNLEESKLEVADAVLKLAAETQEQFYNLQAEMELAKKLETIVAANELAADFARRQYDAGNINDLELHTREASAMESRLGLMEANARVKMEREKLNRLLGLSGAQINWQIANELPPLPEKELLPADLESTAVNQRLDLAASRARAESMAAALRLKQHTRFIPGAVIGVDTERTPDGQRVTGPTLDLELPIFDQGQPAIAKLAAEYEQAKDNYTALETNVRSEVREAGNALLAAREAVNFSQQTLLPMQKQILGETLMQYNAMQKNSFDLLVSKEHEQEAEQTAVTALRDYWIARVELERVVGGNLASENNQPERNMP
ncbi:MAG TPA: TolC family protein [Pseudomonadales bacterium]|nr:TolC family protein [Pseudomonadales bacterium]